MDDCCNIKKVATVTVYENKNEVKHHGYMAGDRNTPVLEVIFRHFWDIQTLKDCKLRWVLVDDTGSLVVGETSISDDNKASIPLPNELFDGERRMKVQLTVASCDGSRILNLQQITDLKVISSLATNEVVEPVYGILINGIYDETQKCIESIKKYLLTTPNGGNAEYLRGYAPDDFLKKNYAMSEENAETLKTSTDYKLGDIVSLLGYYSKGDRGAHKRIIESASKVGGIQLANGLWANVLSSNGKVMVEWFGLTPTSDDCSIYFNLAAEFIYKYFTYTNTFGSRQHSNPLMVMKCYPDYYKCKTTIKLSNRRVHEFNGSTLDFNDSTSNIGVICTGRFYDTEGGWYVANEYAISDVRIKGLTTYYDGYFNDTVDFHKKDYMYKQGFVGLDCRGGTNLYNVTVSACERGVNYSTRDTYLCTIKKPYISFCKYGLVLDIDEVENSNENIKIIDGAIGNNWAAFLAHKTGAFFSNVSIDYNWYITEPNNPWETGNYGTPNGILSFDQCWIEDTRSNVDHYFNLIGQTKFSNCYFILPNKKYFIKAENINDLVTFNDCLFGHSCPIATDATRLMMRGTTYHKLWSTAGGGKFRKVDNLIYNGHLETPQKSESSTPDGNLIPGWYMKQGDSNASGQTFSTLEYELGSDGVKRLLMRNGKFRGCQVWTSKFAVRTGEFLTIKAKADSKHCEVWFYDGSGERIKKQFISSIDGIRYHKLQPVPAGTCFADVIFANDYLDASGTDLMRIEYCEVNVVY